MKELRRVARDAPTTHDILLFYQGSVEDGREFFQRFWPEARAVSDTTKQFYDAFGLERAGLKQLLGPEVLACGLRAAANGSVAGTPVGDTRMMPGAFFVRDGEVLWQHTYRHIADHPNFDKIAVPTMKASTPE